MPKKSQATQTPELCSQCNSLVLNLKQFRPNDGKGDVFSDWKPRNFWDEPRPPRYGEPRFDPNRSSMTWLSKKSAGFIGDPLPDFVDTTEHIKWHGRKDIGSLDEIYDKGYNQDGEHYCPLCRFIYRSVVAVVETKRQPHETQKGRISPDFGPERPLLPGIMDESWGVRNMSPSEWEEYKKDYRASKSASRPMHNDITEDMEEVVSKVENAAEITCELRWILDGRVQGPMDSQGRGIDTATRPLTRRLVLSTPSGVFSDVHIVPLLDPHEMTPPVDKSFSSNMPTFMGRRVSIEQVQMPTIRRWMDLCLENHGGTCTGSGGHKSQDDIEAPDDLVESMTMFPNSTPVRRFVDLQEQRLVSVDDMSTRVRYATLSYVWGKHVVEFQLLADNLCDLSEPGGISIYDPRLSRTVRDAMMLAAALELRYIWIDSLCIVQDSSDDWEQIAPLMDKIYSNGFVNICNAFGQKADDGIPGTPLTPRRTTQVTTILNNGELTLVAAQPSEAVIQTTVWSTRAWTFQERMLASRSIIFTKDRVFFQCQATTWCEDIDSDSGPETTAVWTVDLADSPLRKFKSKPFRRYTDLLQQYTKRSVSDLADRLMAFMGMSSALAVPLHATILYGLPNTVFDWALLWEEDNVASRLKFSRIWEYRRGVYSPSWSWTGWGSEITWRPSMVGGILGNLHEWLMTRTWVVWYISKISSGVIAGTEEARNALVNSSSVYQPVWSPDLNPPPTTTSRWTGYTTFSSGSSSQQDPFGRPLRSRSNPILGIQVTQDLPTYPTAKPLYSRLHFWTYTAYFRLSAQAPSSSSPLPTGLRRFSLLDARGDWCGTIVLSAEPYSDTAEAGTVAEFAAISEARGFSSEELDDDYLNNYHVPSSAMTGEGDDGVGEWNAVYAIMLRKWETAREDLRFCEREGLAKIYKEAFRHDGKLSYPPGVGWREICMM